MALITAWVKGIKAGRRSLAPARARFDRQHQQLAAQLAVVPVNNLLAAQRSMEHILTEEQDRRATWFEDQEERKNFREFSMIVVYAMIGFGLDIAGIWWLGWHGTLAQFGIGVTVWGLAFFQTRVPTACWRLVPLLAGHVTWLWGKDTEAVKLTSEELSEIVEHLASRAGVALGLAITPVRKTGRRSGYTSPIWLSGLSEEDWGVVLAAVVSKQMIGPWVESLAHPSVRIPRAHLKSLLRDPDRRLRLVGMQQVGRHASEPSGGREGENARPGEFTLASRFPEGEVRDGTVLGVKVLEE